MTSLNCVKISTVVSMLTSQPQPVSAQNSCVSSIITKTSIVLRAPSVDHSCMPSSYSKQQLVVTLVKCCPFFCKYEFNGWPIQTYSNFNGKNSEYSHLVGLQLIYYDKLKFDIFA